MARKKVLVCTPVTALVRVNPGDVQEPCSQCGVLVWISPSSWTILHDNPGTAVICTGCAAGLGAAARSVRTHEPTPAQMDEIKDLLEAEE